RTASEFCRDVACDDIHRPNHLKVEAAGRDGIKPADSGDAINNENNPIIHAPYVEQAVVFHHPSRRSRNQSLQLPRATLSGHTLNEAFIQVYLRAWRDRKR